MQIMKNVMLLRPIPLCLSALSGLLIFVSFIVPGQFYVTWFALVPLFFALADARMRHAPWLGLASGFTASVGLVYWIFPTVYRGTNSLAVAAVCLVLLAVYMGLYTALWSFLLRAVWVALSPAGLAVVSGALWVAVEYLRSYVLKGFTWGFLGYSQTPFLDLVQIAEFTGVYGIGFLIVLVNAAVFVALKKHRLIPLAVAALLVIVTVAAGRQLRRNSGADTLPPVKVAVLQGNIDQYKKWDRQFCDEIRNVYAGLARAAARETPDVIVWPETSVPGCLPLDGDTCVWVRNLVRETNTCHIIGSAYMLSGNRQYNASVLFTPRGEISAFHMKTRLVAFGEFIPLRGVFGRFVGALNETGDLTAGEKPEVLMVKGTGWGPNICSENFFGDVVRHSVLNGAEVIVNQTNDGWYGNSAEPRQHFAMNIIRAIETRRPVVVCANTGLSATVNAAGEVSNALPLFTAGYYTADILPARRMTFYVRYGDYFVVLCCALCALLTAGVWIKKKC